MGASLGPIPKGEEIATMTDTLSTTPDARIETQDEWERFEARAWLNAVVERGLDPMQLNPDEYLAVRKLADRNAWILTGNGPSADREMTDVTAPFVRTSA